MKRVIAMSLPLLAIVAVNVVGPAPAAAAELPEFTTESAYKGTSGKLTLESKNGTKVTCTGSSIEGAVLSKWHGTFHLSETECSTLGGLIKCTTKGDTTGTVLVSGEWTLATKSEKEAFMKLIISGAPFACGETTEEIKGALLAKIGPLSTKTTKFELVVKETKGKPESTEYTNELGEKESVQLLMSTKGAEFEEAGEEFGEDKLTTEKETEIKFGKGPTVTVSANPVDLELITMGTSKTASFTFKVEAGSMDWFPSESRLMHFYNMGDFTTTITKDGCLGKRWKATQTCKVEINLKAELSGKLAEVKYAQIWAPTITVEAHS